ncbi:hypothetical protein [Ochrobactrum sp. A-1]|uniref:hypothetical protein n=1 Tax=Ochrobactrum sp. A-1 TaxID=2920940 RepID=UPI001F0A1B1C|nr:hypothetical protein [Ochrobactrum sp. A-1]
MAFPSLDPSQVFRDFVIRGMPSSGAWKPKKTEIRQMLKSYEGAILSLIAGQGGDIELTRGVIYFSVTGGTDNEIIAEPDAELPEGPGSALFILGGLTSENSGAVTINGKELRTNSGGPVPAGFLNPGMLIVFADMGDHYRMAFFGDADAAATRVEEIAAQFGNVAEAVGQAQEAAIAAQTAATSVIDALEFLNTPRSLLEALSDPLLPTPYFIDGWTSGDFAGFNMANPNGVTSLPTDSMLQPILEFNVTGTAGTQTLTVNSGDGSKGQGVWAAVIQHDDNTYGAYMVTALGSGSCTIWPNLRATVTAKTMRNMGGSSNGQHYTEPGYRALAHRVFRATKADAYRVRYVDAWDAQTGDAWDPVNPLSPTSVLTINNVIANAANRARWAFVSRSRRVSRGSGTVGRGQTRDFDLKGKSGMLEVFASRADISASGKFYNVRIMASVDGTPFHDQTYTENDGLVRVFVPFPAGSVGTVLIDPVDEAGGNTYVDNTTWWVYDRLETWTNRAIDINAKTVVIGDSWTTFYPTDPALVDGILGRELRSLMAAAGGSGQVVSVGQGGQTAEWGLANFDARVLPENPKQVLILFFTNDAVQYGQNGYSRWMTAMFKIGRKCQMIGANPIYVMPLPTSSFAQSIDHGIWASALGKGLPLER